MNPPTPCCWIEDDDGNWVTACGGLFVLTAGTPRENTLRFCPYCGGKLKTKRDR